MYKTRDGSFEIQRQRASGSAVGILRAQAGILLFKITGKDRISSGTVTKPVLVLCKATLPKAAEPTAPLSDALQHPTAGCQTGTARCQSRPVREQQLLLRVHSLVRTPQVTCKLHNVLREREESH